MKSSLGISNFLEDISSLSYSVVFLYFFALITEEGYLTSPYYSLELCIPNSNPWQKQRVSSQALQGSVGRGIERLTFKEPGEQRVALPRKGFHI